MYLQDDEVIYGKCVFLGTYSKFRNLKKYVGNDAPKFFPRQHASFKDYCNLISI